MENLRALGVALWVGVFAVSGAVQATELQASDGQAAAGKQAAGKTRQNHPQVKPRHPRVKTYPKAKATSSKKTLKAQERERARQARQADAASSKP